MKRMLAVLAMAWLAAAAAAGDVSTEGFESGFTSGEPVRVHADWFTRTLTTRPRATTARG